MKPRIPTSSPGRILLGSFIFAIGIGTFLLMLPRSQVVEMSLVDILFTATSATCVTGLKAVPISNFTLFGKCIILALVQIGGLGLMTLSFFLVSIFLNLGMTAQLVAGQMMEFELWNKIKPFLILIVGVTFISEAVGTLMLYSEFQHLPNPWFVAFFHSISAFCNAGISLFDNSLGDFKTNTMVLGTIAGLMFAGSIGFIVWYDFGRTIKAYIKSFKEARPFTKLSLHSKIVISTSVMLTLIAAIVFLFLENDNLLRKLTWWQKGVNSLFVGVSARGIGYETVSINNAILPTLLLFLPLMFIGASPGSTGSGIKTTTFAVFVSTVRSILRGRDSVEIRGRSIAHDQVYKVVAIVSLAITWIFLSTFILLLIETNLTFIQVLFECVSTFGCCGLSTGITPGLSVVSKSVLMLTMIIGRVGSLTLVLALRKRSEKHLYKYPEERIMIG